MLNSRTSGRPRGGTDARHHRRRLLKVTQLGRKAMKGGKRPKTIGVTTLIDSAGNVTRLKTRKITTHE